MACCSEKASTVWVSLVGLAVSVVILVPSVYIFVTEQDHRILFPYVKVAKDFLTRITDEHYIEEVKTAVNSHDIHDQDQMNDVMRQEDQKELARETYKLALFQLMDDMQVEAGTLALASFGLGVINIPLHLLLLLGALLRYPCFMLPWLAVTLLEHIVIGVPLIVFCGIIALYLAFQLHLHIFALTIMIVLVCLFILSLSSWLGVHHHYCNLYRADDPYNFPTVTTECQPLIPAPNPSHNNNNNNNNNVVGPNQYPANYFPASAPAANGIYPHLTHA